ncbi:MAG: class I SAM-dependent methyltransferase [Chloroflexi bacterium]|jgi:SAM-dependent methyltransferase|nr:class I SAM-dependent methyltransferase [Chloroflexota bacterium]MBT7079957.1 class I SAM-dependent methyltransferase [Chloroflexota bacterium]
MGDKIIRPDKNICFSFYNKAIARWDNDIHSLGWGNTESQKVRFSIMSGIGDLNNKSILDIGCGFGDFFGFLGHNGIKPKKYLGIDLNPEMVNRSRRNYPDATFEVADILEDDVDWSFDFVIASGIFALEAPNWAEIVERTLLKMHKISKIGFGVNFLSTYTTGDKQSESHFANPSEILSLVSSNISTNVVLKHDYRPNDFTIYVYKPLTHKKNTTNSDDAGHHTK